MKTVKSMSIVLAVALQATVLAASAQMATIEAQVLDGATGLSIATGGPWPWDPAAWYVLDMVPLGDNRTVIVKARDADGSVTAIGQMTGITVGPSDMFGGGGGGDFGWLLLIPDQDGFLVNVNFTSDVGHLTMVPITPLKVTVDIRPGSAQNNYSLNSQGRLPVAVLGSASFDVTAIDPASVRLAGVAPVQYAVMDTPESPDGFPDLVLQFPMADLTATLGAIPPAGVVKLVLRGALFSGMPIVGSDSVTITPLGNKKNGAK